MRRYRVGGFTAGLVLLIVAGLIGRRSCSQCAPGLAAYPAWQGRDLDCRDVGRPVCVIGRDPHGLDADGDGVGCEGW